MVKQQVCLPETPCALRDWGFGSKWCGPRRTHLTARSPTSCRPASTSAHGP